MTGDHTTLADHYRHVQDAFDHVVAAMPADAWDEPSACTEWSRRDVLGHVVWGQELVRHLATGVPFDDRTGAPGAPRPGVLIGDDPLGTWRSARAASVAALTPASLDRVVSLRHFGELPLAGFVTALVTDFLAHTWDIAAPAGIAVRFDDDVVAFCGAWSRSAIRRGPGGIGPERTPPPDADALTRLLAFLGRGAAVPV